MDISLTKFKDLADEEIKNWIQEQVYNLADDYGQKLDNEQGRHIASRLLYTLKNTKLKNWEPETIYRIFQLGLTGQYGKTTRITYQVLISWLWTHERNTRSENKSYPDTAEETEKSPGHYKKTGDKCLPFILYCHSRDIDITGLDPHQYADLRDKYNQNGPAWLDAQNLPRYKPIGNFNKSIL